MDNIVQSPPKRKVGLLEPELKIRLVHLNELIELRTSIQFEINAAVKALNEYARRP